MVSWKRPTCSLLVQCDDFYEREKRNQVRINEIEKAYQLLLLPRYVCLQARDASA